MIEYLGTNGMEYSQKKSKYQIDFTYIVQGTGFHVPISVSSEDPDELEEETKEMTVKERSETATQVVKMRMKIAVAPEELMVDIKDKLESDKYEPTAYCVEFSRREGDQVYFATAYHVLTQTILSFAIEAV